jgi:hypothetical protein
VGAALLSHGSLSAQPTRAGLIQAWEALQRSDPETTAFEKRSDNVYHFATKRFPFDGELKLLNATVEEANGFSQFIPGIVEVELVGLPEKVLRDYERSYSYWTRGNTLYYDVSSKRWLAGKEFGEAVRQKGAIFGGSFWSWLPTLLLVGFLLLFIGMIVRAQRRQQGYVKRVERSLEISERILQLSEKSAQRDEQRLEILRERRSETNARLDRASEKSDRLLEVATESLQVLKRILEELRKGGS